jgi:AcrR family transcriptional regulator
VTETHVAAGSDLGSTVKDAGLVEQRRSHIAAAAIDLARQQGFAHTTTRLIASGAGINIATMYQYFRTKEDILFYVCRTNFEQIRAATSVRQDDPVRELEERFVRLLTVVDDRLTEITFVYQESHTLQPQYLAEVKTWDESAVDDFEAPLRAAVAAGQAEVSNPRLAARQLVETGYAWANKNWSLRRSATREEYTQTHWKWFCRAFRLTTRETA